MATVNRLSMVIFMQHDLDKAIWFYQTLGCALRFRLPGQWAELGLADITIGLCPTSQPAEPRRTGLVFAIDDLQDFYQTHRETFTFLNEPVTKIHGSMVSLQDPHGNIMDLYQATPEKVKDILKQKESSECCQEDDILDQCCKKS